MSAAVEEIQQQVAKRFGVTVADLLGRSKADHITRPRFFAYRRLRDELGLDFQQIANVFGRDRVTISRGYRSAEKYCRLDLSYATHFRDCRPRYRIEDAGHTTPCWIWLGSRGPDGYGWWKHGDKAQVAHRVSYELNVGPIPAGLEIDHLCRNRGCVNPEHLEPVTARENSRRRDEHKARNAVDSLSVGLLLR